MRIYQEEIFGPVLDCVRASNLTEGIDLINAHPFGNGVSCFTRDGHVSREFSRRVQVGMVGIDVSWKQSMFGDTHVAKRT
jgi:malonate-semialdehyde dehydrogenase (acetylating)/methylmalonate-semialdehyde dehydrogenase